MLPNRMNLSMDFRKMMKEKTIIPKPTAFKEGFKVVPEYTTGAQLQSLRPQSNSDSFISFDRDSVKLQADQKVDPLSRIIKPNG